MFASSLFFICSASNFLKLVKSKSRLKISFIAYPNPTNFPNSLSISSIAMDVNDITPFKNDSTAGDAANSLSLFFNLCHDPCRSSFFFDASSDNEL